MFTRSRQQGPRLVGRAGAGLESADWAVSKEVADVGRSGELRTAAELHRLLLVGERGPTVLHDLMIPARGMRANIDHVVVSGRHVWLFDSKVWRPGLYWTLFGRTRRGWERIEWADKKTYIMASRCISDFLAANGLKAKVHATFLVVWSSSARGKPNCTWYKPRGAKVIAGEELGRVCRLAHKPADQAIVQALARLATDKTAAFGYVADDDGWS